MPFQKNHKLGMYGKHHSRETKDKIGLANSGKYGEKATNWKGGKMLVDGYIYIYSPNHPFKTKAGYVVEHRLVMERKLGRYLTSKEVVHHINHNKTDNREENLQLYSSVGMHTKYCHDVLKTRNKYGEFTGKYKCSPQLGQLESQTGRIH